MDTVSVSKRVVKTDTRVTLVAPKACSCGIVHREIPAGARLLAIGDRFDGYYFECICLSTLFSKLDQVVKS